jgi:hypothetical protein
VLEYVPSSFKVIRHVRPKLSCRACETIVQAPMPSLPIERGRPGPRLMAHVAVAKFADHIPLHRQAMMYAREGVDGGCAVSTILHQNVEHDTVLVDRAPQIMQHAADADEHLIKVPGIAGLRPSRAQPTGEVSPELQAPMPDAFVGHHDASFSQDQLDIA